MAYLQRLILGLVLLVSGVCAHASFAAPTVYTFKIAASGVAVQQGSDAAAVCQGFAAAVSPPGTYTGVTLPNPMPIAGTQLSGSCLFSRSGSNLTQAMTVYAAIACPANSTGTSSCTCNTGYSQGTGADASACLLAGSAKWQQWCSAANGLSVGTQNIQTASIAVQRTGCLGGINIVGSPVATPGYVTGDLPDGAGCTMSLDPSAVATPKGTGWQTTGEGTLTGGTCMEGVGTAAGVVPTGAPTGTTSTSQTDSTACPAGMGTGQVNGQDVCKPVGSDTPTVAQAPKSGSETSVNSDGSKVVTTTSGTTTCTQGTCTTVVSTTVNNVSAAGATTSSTTTSDTKSQPQGTYCAGDGKGSAQCSGDGSSSSFGGSCASGFKAVSDDAVINAMAQEIYTQDCKVNPDAPSQVIGQNAMTADATNAPGYGVVGNPGSASVSIGSSNFDTSDAIGAGSACLNDRSYTIWHATTVVLPLSTLCSYMQMMGAALMAISFLIAAAIVFRGN